MIIKSIEIFHVVLPMKFDFKTAKTVLKNRETLIVRIKDELGYTGYGEIVAFRESFYSDETIIDAKRILAEKYLRILVGRSVEHPFEIHEIIDKTYPMTVAGLENALLDVYAKRHNQFILDSVFEESINTKITAGVTIGDLDLSDMINQIKANIRCGYSRFKLKIKPGSSVSKVKKIREIFPDIRLLVDANRSFRMCDFEELEVLDTLDLLCIEEPLAESDYMHSPMLQAKMKTPICLDESIASEEALEHAIHSGAMRMINLKIGRVGGMYYTKKMIDMCRANGIGFWIGSMVESGISKSLHVYLAGLKDVSMPGDLSASSRYFEKDLIHSGIQVCDGKIEIKKKIGLSVDVDEEYLVTQTIDYFSEGPDTDEVKNMFGEKT